MIVDAAHFSDGEFEEDIDGAAASCSEHKILIVMFVFIKTPTTITHWVAGPPSCRWAGGRRPRTPRARSARSPGSRHPRWPAAWTQQSYL